MQTHVEENVYERINIHVLTIRFYIIITDNTIKMESVFWSWTTLRKNKTFIKFKLYILCLPKATADSYINNMVQIISLGGLGYKHYEQNEALMSFLVHMTYSTCDANISLCFLI